MQSSETNPDEIETIPSPPPDEALAPATLPPPDLAAYQNIPRFFPGDGGGGE